MILTDFRIQKTNIKSSDLEMFWSRIFTLLSNNPNLDLIITSSDTSSKIDLEVNKENNNIKIGEIASSENFLKTKLKELIKIYKFKELKKINNKIDNNSFEGSKEEAIKSLSIFKQFK